jgi:hypothetical protein
MLYRALERCLSTENSSEPCGCLRMVSIEVSQHRAMFSPLLNLIPSSFFILSLAIDREEKSMLEKKNFFSNIHFV